MNQTDKEMKWKKFELIIKGDNAVIRATIKPWYYFFTKKYIVRDVFKDGNGSYGSYRFMDNDDFLLYSESRALHTFYLSGLNEFIVNGNETP